MKKWIAYLLIAALLFVVKVPAISEQTDIQEKEQLEYFAPNNPELLQYIEDSVYANLEEEFASDHYTIEEVCAVYVSSEYLEEMEYYSRSNIYFGYTLEELDARFEGKRYFFTLGDDNQTTVKEYEAYAASTDLQRILKNVAIGAGVILICVTVTYFTKGTGTPKTIQIIHCIASKAAYKTITEAASDAFVGAASAAITEMYESGDINTAIHEAALSASEGFKWGAITGSIKGGIKGVIGYNAKQIPSWLESERKALELYNDGKNSSAQVAFYNKEKVNNKVLGSTIPDVVRWIDDHYEGIEVKNYDCKNHLSQLLREVKREVKERVINMPDGSTQRLVLDFRGRDYTQFFADSIRDIIQEYCMDIYPNLPVDFIWA